MTTDWFDKWVMQKADKINRKHELVQKAKYAKEQSYNSVIKANGLGDEVRRHDSRLDTVPDLTFKMYHAENKRISLIFEIIQHLDDRYFLILVYCNKMIKVYGKFRIFRSLRY